MAKTLAFNSCIAAYNSIMSDIQARRFSPVYLLMGDEAYFIDAIADSLASTILNEAASLSTA